LVPDWGLRLQCYGNEREPGRGTAAREIGRLAGVGDVAWQEKEKIDEINRRCTKKDPGPSLSEYLAHNGRIWNGTWRKKAA